MSIRDEKWFEVWFVDGEDIAPSSLLIVIPDKHQSGQIIVLDPQENYKIIHRGANYEDVRCWLLEDEYEQVDGRVFTGDRGS